MAGVLEGCVKRYYAQMSSTSDVALLEAIDRYVYGIANPILKFTVAREHLLDIAV